MSLRAVLIDDEITSIKTLEIELNRHCPNVDILKAFQDPNIALQDLPNLEFDIMFLDIEMPWLNGFELLSRLGSVDCEVVFVTAYDQYAIQAFKVSAIDYLLKPIQSAELVSCVNRISAKKERQNDNLFVKNLLHNLNKKNIGDRKLILPTNEGIDFVTISTIIHCQAESNYTRIVTKDGQLFLAKTLKDIEEMLGGYNFFRVHSSHLINTDYIRRFSKSEGTLVMSNDQVISVSRLRKEAFLSFLAEQ